MFESHHESSSSEDDRGTDDEGRSTRKRFWIVFAHLTLGSAFLEAFKIFSNLLRTIINLSFLSENSDIFTITAVFVDSIFLGPLLVSSASGGDVFTGLNSLGDSSSIRTSKNLSRTSVRVLSVHQGVFVAFFSTFASLFRDEHLS